MTPEEFAFASKLSTAIRAVDLLPDGCKAKAICVGALAAEFYDMPASVRYEIEKGVKPKELWQ